MSDLLERSKPANGGKKLNARLRYFLGRLKMVAKSGLEKLPYIGDPAIRMWRGANDYFAAKKLLLEKWRLRYVACSHSLTDEEINATVYVSPQDIVFESLVEYGFEKGQGLVLSGDWDRLEKRFDALDVYVALEEVIKGHKSWQQTVYYQRILGKLEGGEILWDCANKMDLDARCAQLDALIESITKTGYKSQEELNTKRVNDEIIINIGRSGDLLFSNGAHRLSIAKILGINKIPVKIAVRHTQWMQFRVQYAKFALERDRKAYQPALHPDLQQIPSHHGCVDRFEVIKKNLSVKQGRLLDLGANLGYFSSKFEEEGFDCVAVENFPRFIYCIQGLRRATNKHFTIVQESILDAKEIVNEPFDVVLALNIFHHFLKSEETFQKFEVFLAHLKCKEIYFEPHLYDESQMVDSYRNMQPNEFAEYIRLQTRLNKIELIGQAEDNRPIYKIS